jgi:hypothetical protein
MHSTTDSTLPLSGLVTEKAAVSRRNFLQLAGGATAAGLLLASCRRTPPDTVYIGTGDTALLNYLYIMETVLAAVYTQANITPYYGMNKSELDLLADLRDHQIAHKGLLKHLLGRSVITEVVTELSPITFADRTDTLSKAYALEDLAIGAYYGAAQRFVDTNHVLTVSKMATVQARHSTYAREILSHNTFTDSVVVDLNGLGQVLSPLTVIGVLKPYIQTKLDISNLPA